MTIKKFLFIFLATLSFGNALAIDQIGIAYRYNGKKQRTPLGGVYIKVATSPNGVVSQEQNGQFVLKLKDIKMGDAMGNAIVQKTGMMVFNKEEVNRWHVQKGALVLIVCDANEFQKQKAQLITIGRNQAEKKYKQKIELLKAQNAKQQLSLDQYYAKLDSIEKEKNNALAHMDEYADLFARIDESEVDTLAQRAIELFNQGQLEKAIKLFEKGNYLEKLDDDLKVKAQAEELRLKADSADALADKDIEVCLKSIEAQVAAYKMSNEWDKAGTLLKELADKLKSLDAIWNYACFAQKQNQFIEAEEYLKLYLYKLKSSDKLNESALAAYYNNLAMLYSKTQRLTESEQIYKKALDIRKRLSKTNPQSYEPDLAVSYNNIAILYGKVQRFTESEQMFKEALEIRKRLANTNPQAYESDLAACYNNLALLYSDTQRFTESEQMYKEALEIRKRLVNTNPQAYESDLATSYNNIASLYLKIQRFTESEQMYEDALKINKHLADANPQAYEPDLAQSYHNLANLYSATHSFTESENMYNAALIIFKRLAGANPQAFEPDLAVCYNALASLYGRTKHFTKSEQMHKEALQINKRLAETDPQVYKPKLADTYYCLANLYLDIQRFTESENMYKTALDIFKRLIDTNPQIYERNLAANYFGLASLYNITQRYTESEQMYKSALEIDKRLAEANPQAYTPLLAINYKALASLYCDIQRFTESEQMYKYSFEMYKRLTDANPQIYKQSLAECYNDLVFLYILTRQFDQIEKKSKEVLMVDSTNLIAHNNLAAAYLFQGKYAEAERIYRQYKSKFKEHFLLALETFAKAGVIPTERMADVEKIKKMLNE